MDDPAERICDALVETINSLALSLTIEASKPSDPLGELTLEHPTLQAIVFPFGETTERQDRGGGVLERFAISVMVIRMLSAEFTRDRLEQFVRELKSLLRGKKMAGYTWSAEETATKFDLTQLHEQDQFLSLVRLTYIGTC